MPQNGDEDVSVGTSTVDGAARVARVVEGPSHARAAGGADVFTELDALPVADHVARFEAVHDVLRARLAGEPTDGGAA